MKSLRTPVVIGVLITLIAAPVWSATTVTFDGQIRARSTLDDRFGIFDTTLATDHFAELRTRFGVKAEVDDNAIAYIQFQDSRVAGEYNQFGLPSSGALNDGKNVDMHQAYIKVKRIFGRGWGGKAGRFEFVKGNHRVFGNVGWSNVGRTWDGMQLWYQGGDNYKTTLFWLKRLELQNPEYNRDFDIFGFYSSVGAWNLDLFGFYEYNADSTGYVYNRLDRFNVGLYYHRVHLQWDFTLNGVYQFGKMPNSVSPDSLELDISAFMFAFEAGFTFPGPNNARVAVGIDYSSGDDFSDSTKVKTYQNSYYTGHKFRGYMDYFVSSNPGGLMDLMLRGSVDPAPGWTIKGDLHYFSTAQDYVSPIDTSLTKDVGIEFDLTVSTTRVAGVELLAGASIFLPQEAFAGMTDPDPGFWAYSMATLDFEM